MSDASAIREHMEVIGADGVHAEFAATRPMPINVTTPLIRLVGRLDLLREQSFLRGTEPALATATTTG
jgi:hypothetical protein